MTEAKISNVLKIYWFSSIDRIMPKRSSQFFFMSWADAQNNRFCQLYSHLVYAIQHFMEANTL